MCFICLTLQCILIMIGNTRALYQLSGYPSTVTEGANFTLAITCNATNYSSPIVRFLVFNATSVIVFAFVSTNNCTIIPGEDFDADNGYSYGCDLQNNQYFVNISFINIQEEMAHEKWACGPQAGSAGKNWSLTVWVPIKNVSLSPAGSDNVVNVLLGDTQTFTCKTDSGRPAAWIQWYFGKRNVTNQATPKINKVGSKFISSSTLNYTGKNDDHNKMIYCEAVNIEGRQEVVSIKKLVYIKFPIKSVALSTTSNNDLVSIVEGNTSTFTCTTSFGRPAAWIQWYIGKQNVTNQATADISSESNQNVSTSTLVYTGMNSDHNKHIYCEAVNIEGQDKVRSPNKTLYIQIPVPNVVMTPTETNNTVYVVINNTQMFSCETGLGRPSSSVHWFIGGKNMTFKANTVSNKNGTMFTSTSTLIYKGNDSDHNKTILCAALNVKGKRTDSGNTVIYIQFPVTKATIMSVGDVDIIRPVLDHIKTITCTTDAGRPAAWIKWYIGGRNVTNQASTVTTADDTKFKSTSTLNYMGKDADHNKTIHCEAENIEGRQKIMSGNRTLYVIVPISSVQIEPIFPNRSVTVILGEDHNFTCATDPGRPAALIHWYIGGRNFTNQATTVEMHEDTKVKSRSYLNYIGDMSGHNQSLHCEAVDLVNRTSSQIESLYVLSRAIHNANYSLENEVYIGRNDRLNLTVHLIANPTPTITWSFQGEWTNANSFKIKVNVTSLDIFRHVTTYEKEQVVPSDFGNYTIEAFNGIGKKFIHVISVKSARAPDPPSDLNVACSKYIPSINVSWVSNFNGGTEQTFCVVFRNIITDIVTNLTTETDKGQGEIHSQESLFDHQSYYEIYVEAHNKYGSVNSSGVVNCTTSKEIKESTGPPLAVIGTAAGSITAVIFVAVICVIIFARRRQVKKGEENQFLHGFNGRKRNMDNDINDNDGLKDNPLYNMSSVSIDATEYAHEQNYAKETKCSHEGKQVKNGKQKENKGCVYENAEDFRKDEMGKLYGNVGADGTSLDRTRKNKRNTNGLIYADLEFAATQAGGKFVIRGFENKTNYAVIDLSKKADPLSSGSDEDDSDARREDKN